MNIPMASRRLIDAPQATAVNAPNDGKSLLVRELERARAAREATRFPVSDFVDQFGGKPDAVAIRIATVAEQDDSLAQAYAYIEQRSNGAPGLKNDVDFVQVVKTVHILSEVVRDARDPENMRAFPDAAWMRENFNPHQIRILLDHYNAVVAKTLPGEGKVEPEWVLSLAEQCALWEHTGIPDGALIQCSREMLVEMFVRLSMMHMTALAENEALKTTIAEMK